MHIMRVLFVAAVVGAWLLGMGGLGWGSYEPKRRYPLTDLLAQGNPIPACGPEVDPRIHSRIGILLRRV